jgi:GntR family transcriptional repressor for pyruvate dehydrogenase complex
MVSGENINLTEQTVSLLQKMVINSGLTAGEPFFTESQLEEKLGVSRQTIRDAVSRLRGIGILESKKRVGLVVSKPDPVGLFGQGLNTDALGSFELQQLAELRYTLELGAIDLVVQRASEQQLERLSDLAEEFAASYSIIDDTRSCDEIDRDFHQAILQASGSEMLTRIHNIISAYFSRSRLEIEGWQTELTEKSVWEHRLIAESLQQRDAERAKSILKAHLSNLIV